MRRTRVGYTTKQYAYANGVLSGSARTKKAIALNAGFSPSVAASVSAHIEKTEGYSNAMAELASQTGNVALKVLHELKHRDITKESTSTLLQAITVMSAAWDKFTPKAPVDNPPSDKASALRAIFVDTIRDIPSESVKDNPIDTA